MDIGIYEHSYIGTEEVIMQTMVNDADAISENFRSPLNSSAKINLFNPQWKWAVQDRGDLKDHSKY